MRSNYKEIELTSEELDLIREDSAFEQKKRKSKVDKWADKPAMEVRDLHFAYGKNKS